MLAAMLGMFWNEQTLFVGARFAREDGEPVLILREAELRFPTSLEGSRMITTGSGFVRPNAALRVLMRNGFFRVERDGGEIRIRLGERARTLLEGWTNLALRDREELVAALRRCRRRAGRLTSLIATERATACVKGDRRRPTARPQVKLRTSRLRKACSVRTTRRDCTVVVTVALRGTPCRRAISPKTSPAPSTATRSPDFEISTQAGARGRTSGVLGCFPEHACSGLTPE
jgi:hypothetical protein